MVKGHLPDHWSDWFGGLTLTLNVERGEVTLSGLHSLLNKVHDLGLVLLLVNRI